MRHRVFRHLAMLVTLLLALAGLVPVASSSSLAQPSDTNEWTNDTYGFTIGWSDDWTVEAGEITSTANEPDVLTLTNGDAALTLRGEAADLAPADRLDQEIGHIIYLDGTEAEITETGESVATAEWRSDSWNRLVSVIATGTGDANLVVTLVAQAADFDAAIESAAAGVTLDDDPLLGSQAEPRDTDQPADQPTAEPTEEPRDTDQPDESPTAEPTGEPRDTDQPADQPTEEPTEEPRDTDQPDESPTADPTDEAEETPDVKLPTEEPLGGGVVGSTYTSPNFGYSFEWDSRDWEVAEDGEVSEEGYDLLSLVGDDGGLNIYAFEDYGGDPVECLEAEAEFISSEAGIEDWQPAEDGDGNPIAGETEDSAYAVYTLSYTDPETERGPSRSLANYLECRSIGGDAVLIIWAISPINSYNDHIDQVLEVTETITLLDEAEPAETPADDLDIDEDRIEDEEPPSDTEEEVTPEATEEAPEDRPDPDTESDPDSGVSAVEGSVFTSPGFGFTLDIPTTWTVEDEVIEAGNEQLVLSNGTSTVTVWATSEYEGEDLASCVTFAADASGLELELDVREDGSPFVGADDITAYGAYVYDLEGTEQTYFIKCSWIEEGTSVLIIVQDVPTADYSSERRARRQIENLIDLP
jgi:outer membrane biosynthesis protein TonB